MKFKKYIIFMSLLSLTSSCSNILEGISSTETDDAILYSARMHLAKGEWTEALDDFAKLPTSTLAETDVVIDRASAYSGRCGLDFLNLATQIENIGTTHIMTMLLQNITASAAANYADCRTAEDLLKTISDAQGIVPTERGQFLMAFNSIAKIGAILNFRADSDKNGTVDAGWDPRDAVNGDTYLPQAEVNEITVAIALFYQNLKNNSYAASLISEIDTICTTINGSPQDFCSTIDEANVTANQRPIIRGMVVETTDGIGLSIRAGDTISNVCGT